MDICFYRVKIGLTQQQCADIIGCNLRTWLRLEKSDDSKYIPEKYMFYEKTKKFLGEKKMKDQFSVVRPARKRAMTRSFNGEGAAAAISGFGKAFNESLCAHNSNHLGLYIWFVFCLYFPIDNSRLASN